MNGELPSYLSSELTAVVLIVVVIVVVVDART